MRIKSYGSVKVYEPETDEIIGSLDAFVRKLKNHEEVSAVWLIGSFHRKDFGPFSDIDLVLIVRESNERFIDRSLRFRPDTFPVPMDLFVYTLAEVQQMRESGHLFWKDIEGNHTALFER